MVGMAGVQERVRGVLHLGMAIVPAARGRGGGWLLVEAVLEHARSVGAHKPPRVLDQPAAAGARS